VNFMFRGGLLLVVEEVELSVVEERGCLEAANRCLYTTGGRGGGLLRQVGRYRWE
jgi:hypothetical protein